MRNLKFIVLAATVGVLNLGSPARALANFVQNGGFESGDSTDWTVSDPSHFAVLDSIPTHSGSYAADWGGDPVTISQTLPTVAGSTYQFSFWVDTIFAADFPSFEANWNGSSVLDITGSSYGNAAYTPFTFTETADGPTTISFTASDTPGALQLDDISVNLVSSVPDGGSTAVLLCGGLLFLALLTRRRFSV